MKDRSGFITFLRLLGYFLPGNYLKTAFYLNVIAKPRKALRNLLNNFYRMDHIYDVLKEVKGKYKGNFSILEFGTANGYAFTKMLYATKYLRLDHQVTVHAFDSFEGLRESKDPRDQGIVAENWEEGQFLGNYEKLERYCRKHYKNYQFHKGYYEDTLTKESLTFLKDNPPILVWIDCDYYSSSLTIFKYLITYLPNGCVLYFDDYDFNYGSRLTCEAKLVHEINHGLFGDNIELVLDRNLSMDSRRIYRFIDITSTIRYEPISTQEGWFGKARSRTNDSPMP